MIGGPPRATRARYWVIVFAVTLAVIQYVNRVAISKAMPSIQRELHFSNTQAGYIFSAFTLAYSILEIPGGWLGDRLGPKRIMMRVVLLSSFFTVVTASMTGLAGMLTVRLLYGAGESGSFPTVGKAFSAWLPKEERVRAQGVLWLAARWGGALTPLLMVALLSVVSSWRDAFRLLGIPGLIWAILFWRWFRDDPLGHPGLDAAEKELLGGVAESLAFTRVKLPPTHVNVPWRVFLTSRSAWLLWIQYACFSYGWFFYVTWYPKFLESRQGQDHGHDLGPVTLALLAGLPLFGGGFGCLIAGFCAAPLARRLGGVGRARKALAISGFVSASGLLLASTFTTRAVALAVLFALAGLLNDFVMPTAWSACMDVGGRFAGTFSGVMNMMGNLAAVLAPIAVGYILDLTGTWTLTFYISAAVYLVGAVCWLLLDPVTPLDSR